MEDHKFLDFDEAVTFLRTNPSTLYKWLQNNKIPAHKLGRQWRFRREELEAHVSGTAPRQDLRAEIAAVAASLRQKDDPPATPDALAKMLFWYVYDHVKHHNGVLHFQPAGDGYKILHKILGSTTTLATISRALFEAMNAALQKSYQPGREENSRSISVSRDDGEALSGRYQFIETATGPYATCRISPLLIQTPTMELIAPDPAQRDVFMGWLGQPQGVIAVTGRYGSGKTTTVYAMLRAAAMAGKTVFTLEDDVPYLVDGVNHVELAARNLAAFERQIGQIVALGADVIGIVVDSFPGLEPALYAEAAHAAKRGQLVILQTASASAESALSTLRENLPDYYEELFLGVIWQELVQQEKGRRAAYTFLRG